MIFLNYIGLLLSGINLFFAYINLKNTKALERELQWFIQLQQEAVSLFTYPK